MNPALQQLLMDMMADPDLKARALADPAAVLAGRGLALPEGHEVRIMEDTATVTHLVLPWPGDAEADAEALEQRSSRFVYV